MDRFKSSQAHQTWSSREPQTSAEVLRDLIKDAEILYWDKTNEVLIFGTIK